MGILHGKEGKERNFLGILVCILILDKFLYIKCGQRKDSDQPSNLALFLYLVLHYFKGRMVEVQVIELNVLIEYAVTQGDHEGFCVPKPSVEFLYQYNRG